GASARASDQRRVADRGDAVRGERSKPLVLALKVWFEQQLARVSAKSLIADAIRYALHHWDGLTRFLEDKMVASNSTPISLNEEFIRWCSIARMHYLRATMMVRRTGPASPRSSRRASSTASI